MVSTPHLLISKDQRLRRAIELAERGDVDAARTAFEQAIALDRRNVDLVYNLALLEASAGEVERAARYYTKVLELKPTHALAIRSFCRLLTRFAVSDPAALSATALTALLNADGIAHQAIIDVAATWLAHNDPTLSAACRDQRSDTVAGQPPSATRLQGRNQGLATDILKSELLLLCLRKGVIKHPVLEQILTDVRVSILLDTATNQFDDRAFTDIISALIAHGWNCDHAWAETAEEAAALSVRRVDRAALLGGDREAVRCLWTAALYRPLDEIVQPALSVDDARRLKPRALRELIEPQVRTSALYSCAAVAVQSLKPLADLTSLRVAGQYEGSPYPRWQSLHVSQPGAMQRALGGYFGPDRVTFMARPYDVLIAGCGTGQQALQGASAYGPEARIVGLDLSRASLGYAATMAERHDVKNVSFVHGDILDIKLLARSFDIIECVGVLHHMTDWRLGWTALLRELKPSGLMYIGLYSAVSRQGLRALRTEPGYPGPGCSRDAARAYRRSLLLDETGPGRDLKISRDFHNLNAFRDLVLHESEDHVRLEDIAAFLSDNDLIFRGFTIDPHIVANFLAAGFARTVPGTLADWAQFERANPRTFDGMYRFWVERRN